jgi:hypothetical protein
MLVTATGAVLNAERRFAHEPVADCRMQEYEKRVRVAERLRRQELYTAGQQGQASIRRG